MSKPEVSIIIPAYNEEDRIVSTIVSICEFFTKKGTTFEVIVVDDGSTDNTSGVITSLSKENPDIRLEDYGKNRGKGAAVQWGMLKAQGELILFADADGATPIAEFDKLSSEIKKGKDIAIGSRALYHESVSLEAKWYRILLGRIFNKCVNVLCVPHIKDTQCGFKLFSPKATQILFSRQVIEGFAFDCELLHIAHLHKLSVSEVAVNWKNVEGSKVNLLIDPLYMFVEILKIRFRSLSGKYS